MSAELHSARDIIAAGIHACKDEMDRAPQCAQIYDLTNLYIDFFCQCVRRDSDPEDGPHTSL